MARKRPTAEKIVAKRRQVGVPTARGRPVAEAIGATEVSLATRAAGRRGLALAGGGQGLDQKLAAARQQRPSAFGPGLPAIGSPGGPMADFARHPGRGPKAGHAPTFTPDHPWMRGLVEQELGRALVAPESKRLPRRSPGGHALAVPSRAGLSE